MPRVSVVMAVHNGERHVREAVASVLGQEGVTWELIVIDDGSTDGTGDLLRQFAGDARVRVVRNDVRRELAWSLNRGWDLARGKYLARLDADDVCMPGRLRHQACFLEEHPEVAVVGGAVELIDDAGRKTGETRYPTESRYVKASLVYRNPLAHPAVMLNRELLDARGLRYDPRIQRGQDYELWTRVAEHYGLANLEEPVLRYRVHAGQVTLRQAGPQLATAAACRAKLVRELVGEATEGELALHERLCRYEHVANWDFVEAVERWLGRLLEGNAARHVYDEEAFGRLTGGRWLNVCGDARELGPELTKHFWGADPAKWVDTQSEKNQAFLARLP